MEIMPMTMPMPIFLANFQPVILILMTPMTASEPEIFNFEENQKIFFQ